MKARGKTFAQKNTYEKKEYKLMCNSCNNGCGCQRNCGCNNGCGFCGLLNLFCRPCGCHCHQGCGCQRNGCNNGCGCARSGCNNGCGCQRSGFGCCQCHSCGCSRNASPFNGCNQSNGCGCYDAYYAAQYGLCQTTTFSSHNGCGCN